MADAKVTVRFTLNGAGHAVTAAAATPLLYVLRNDCGVNSPKYGCGFGECGACCVLIDDRVARSCAVCVVAAEGRSITTLEGLGTAGRPGTVQQAFIAEQAAQCGYCLNGMIMTVEALLRSEPCPTIERARAALRYNLCRCGAHVEIMRAVERAIALHREVS